MKTFNHHISEATVEFRFGATDTLKSEIYTKTMKSTVPNAKWYGFGGRNYQAYLLIRDGLVIAIIDEMENRKSYEPDRFMWKTDYSQPRGGIGLGRGEKRTAARLLKQAIAGAEQQILSNNSTKSNR